MSLDCNPPTMQSHLIMLLFVLLLLFPPPILSAGEQDESFCLFSIGIPPTETGSSSRGGAKISHTCGGILIYFDMKGGPRNEILSMPGNIFRRRGSTGEQGNSD